MEGLTLAPESAVRMGKATKWVEQHTKGGGGQGTDTAPRNHYQWLGRLTADLAYNATGTVSVLAGAVGSESVPSAVMTLPAHNLLYRKLWAGANVACEWMVTEGSGGIYRITWSDSTMRIRGTTSGSIAAGATGTLNTITSVDGRVAPVAPVSVVNLLSNYTVASGVMCWAEWCQAANRWEIYSADCAP